MAKDFHRYLGLDLSGPKNEKSSLCILDYSVKTRRLIVVDIEAKIPGVAETSGDEILIQLVKNAVKESHHYVGLASQAPLSMPPFFKNMSKKDAESKWMDQVWKKARPRPRPFESYLQRPCEIYLKYFCSEKFQVGDAMGSNLAPLMARMQYLKTKFPQPLFESYPKATLSRIVSSFGFSKNIARDYSDLEKGLHSRESFIENLFKKLPQLFIYDKDHDAIVSNLNCFHAFLSALTLFLMDKEEVEKRPKNFPQGAAWIEIPKKKIDWEKSL